MHLTPGDVTAIRKDIFFSLHCAFPGIVESFDAETQTATVRPAVKHLLCHPERSRGRSVSASALVTDRPCRRQRFSDGNAEPSGSPRRSVVSLPLLRDVPVFMPVSFEVNPGDPCLLVFADCDIDNWLESGQAEEPASGRMHSLSDAFAFVGFKSSRR